MTRLPEPSPSYRMGQHHFLTLVPHKPHCFTNMALQCEYDRGYYAERKDSRYE